MKRIPGAGDVDRALRGVREAVAESLRGLNDAAGQVMARGNYAAVEALAASGREIQQFQAEVAALQKRWRALRRGGRGEAGGKRVITPQWGYYQPILKALVELGGEARRTELEPVVERLMRKTFQPADSDAMARSRARWQVMIRRARRLMVSEGWLEESSGSLWQITDEGRRAARLKGSVDA